MARLTDEQSKRAAKGSNARVPGVNIAGDYDERGVDVAPDAMSERDYVDESLDREAIETIEPSSDLAPMSPADRQHMKRRREETARETSEDGSLRDFSTRESLKSATGPSSLGQEAGKRLVNPSSDTNVNTDWPVDE
jgi:hypothetical protein